MMVFISTILVIGTIGYFQKARMYGSRGCLYEAWAGMIVLSGGVTMYLFNEIIGDLIVLVGIILLGYGWSILWTEEHWILKYHKATFPWYEQLITFSRRGNIPVVRNNGAMKGDPKKVVLFGAVWLLISGWAYFHAEMGRFIVTFVLGCVYIICGAWIWLGFRNGVYKSSANPVRGHRGL